MQEAADAAAAAAREVLNDRQAAAFLGVSPGTLANWRSQRTVPLPFCRLGRAVRYRRTDLERYMAAKTIGAAVES